MPPVNANITWYSYFICSCCKNKKPKHKHKHRTDEKIEHVRAKHIGSRQSNYEADPEPSKCSETLKQVSFSKVFTAKKYEHVRDQTHNRMISTEVISFNQALRE